MDDAKIVMALDSHPDIVKAKEIPGDPTVMGDVPATMLAF